MELIYALMVLIPAGLLLIVLLLGFDGGGGDIHIEVEHDVNVGDTGGPGHLGLKLILAFVIGFGLGGFLTMRYDWPIHHVLAGLIGGAAMYLVVYQLLRLLYRQQANTQMSAASVAGLQGEVTSTILKGGVGEIRVMDPNTGHSLYLNARCADPEAELAAGTEVIVKSVGMGMACVDRVQ